jgi:hypothetical protein
MHSQVRFAPLALFLPSMLHIPPPVYSHADTDRSISISRNTRDIRSDQIRSCKMGLIREPYPILSYPVPSDTIHFIHNPPSLRRQTDGQKDRGRGREQARLPSLTPATHDYCSLIIIQKPHDQDSVVLLHLVPAFISRIHSL